MRIAIATEKETPDLHPEEQELIPAFLSKHVEAHTKVWDDESVDWASYEAVLVRSTWDYWKDLTRFLAWVDRLEGLKIRLLNSPAILRWNTDKLYYKELAAKGFPVLPTHWVKAKDAQSTLQQVQALGWDDVIIKPSVSAGGYKVLRIKPDLGTIQEKLTSARYIPGETLMMQPFFQEIQTNGELSLLYFAGTFSHALLKQVRGNEFRVQEKHGGVPTSVDAPKQARKLAEDLLTYVAQRFEMPLYARVDLLEYQNRYLVMELELTEPFLYLPLSKGSVDRFVSATIEVLNA